jgi:hypothetical protein
LALLHCNHQVSQHDLVTHRQGNSILCHQFPVDQRRIACPQISQDKLLALWLEFDFHMHSGNGGMG